MKNPLIALAGALALSFALTLALAVPFAGEADEPGKDGASTARAVIRDASGKEIGIATFTQAKGGGVTVAVQVEGLSPGDHGMHIHAAGRCEGPSFETAAGHFNPGGTHHGHHHPTGGHAGDLPNLKVNARGAGKLDARLANVTLGAGPASLFGPDGTALVIHASADDGKSDPSGHAGERIACGVIAPPRS